MAKKRKTDTPANGEGLGPEIAAAVAICGEHGNRPDALIEILHGIQVCLGYVPGTTLNAIARALNLSRAEVHGVVTFYHDFRDAPAGRHVVKLCRAEACQAVGCETLATHAEQALGTRFGTTSADGKVTLEAVYCLGNCALGPSAMVDGDIHGLLNNNKLDNIFNNIN
ncbi:MAG: formate dehydrogenase subunit gamma [Alphaproteobacteria bacterium]|nr:formate dehydrogenase subunit gamma [Alphaproteobacteria bacterium]